MTETGLVASHGVNCCNHSRFSALFDDYSSDKIKDFRMNADKVTFEAFWSRPPDFGRGREQDPLGLSSLHEAAADVLLPLLSGRTRKAEEYIWVLV
jgi:hypothetical protein